jgi:nucleoside-specific outer membrane channel protein Tsx
MKNKIFAALGFATLTVFPALTASAADWSNTTIGFRWGPSYHEPGIPDSIDKYTISFNHASGYSLGQNFFVVDLWISNSKDPANTASPGTSKGAYDADIVYHHDLDFGKLFKTKIDFGPVRGMSLTTGFEFETKNTGFAPATFKAYVGPTFFFKVPGYLNAGVLYYREWNHNAYGGYAASSGGGINVTYASTYFIYAAWGIPLELGSVSTLFEGFANYTGAKGKNGFGTETVPETLIRAQWMLDVGSVFGGKKGVWLVGPAMEYWHNKFGIPTYEVGQSRPPGAPVNPETITFVASLKVRF